MSRIAIVSPALPGDVSGNNTTLYRLCRGLREAGHEVRAVPVASIIDPEKPDAGTLAGFDLLHALHAFKTGIVVRGTAQRLGVPYVVSITGTDVHEDLRSPARREQVLAVLRDAGAILMATEEPAAMLRGTHGIKAPMVLVLKGVAVPEENAAGEPRNVRNKADLVVFLHVGGWREVKNQLFPLAPLALLWRQIPGIRLRFLGPVLDAAYHRQWVDRHHLYPFSMDGGAVEAARMAREYRAAAVILNTSHSEGGSNAVLEAMAAGRAVLAADIPGNRALMRWNGGSWEESTGILYRTTPAPGEGPIRRLHDAEDFLAKARRLALDPDLRSQIGRNARNEVIARHSPERETDSVLQAYRLAGLKAQ